MAQPNLSQQIARLELLIGYPLFVRRAKGVCLTPAGEFLKHRSDVLMANLRATLTATRTLGSGEVGSLALGFCGSVMLTHVANLLGGFRTSHPDVKLELSELHVNQQLALLQDGMLEACFVRDAGNPASLEILTLLEEPYVAVLPDHHSLARRKRIAPELLKDEPFILFSPDMAQGAYDGTVALCIEHGFRPKSQREAAQWTSLASMIGSGLGISIAPACVASVFVRGVCCVPVVSKRRSSVEIAFRENSGNPSVNKLLEYAKRFTLKHTS